MGRKAVAFHAFVAAMITLSCAPATSPRGSTSAANPPEVATKKRLVASIFSDPAGFHQQLTNRVVGSVSGLAELQQLVHAGLTYPDDRDVLQPRLAEAVPSIDTGLWKLLPDGRMETTWHLRPNLLWHDGAPITSEDLAFAIRVNRDKEIGIQTLATLELI